MPPRLRIFFSALMAVLFCIPAVFDSTSGIEYGYNGCRCS